MIRMKVSLRSAACAAAGAALVVTAPLFAGGTPENAVLIIDPTDPASMYVGNYYKNARNIPDANVLYMRSAATDYPAFVSTNQAAFVGALGQRALIDHADYVVLAPLNKYAISMPAGTITDSCYAPQQFSISSAYTIAQISDSVLAGGLPSTTANLFAPTSVGVSAAFDAQIGYYVGNPSPYSTARRYYIGAMLGYVNGAFNNVSTVPELLTMIDRSVAADGTRPTSGVFYFMNKLNDCPRNERSCSSFNCLATPPVSCTTPDVYNTVASLITSIGGAATVLTGNNRDGDWPPNNTTNIMGIMSAVAGGDLPGANLTLVPGAFCDHLTSGGAFMDCGPQCQMTVPHWIRAGASGSEGAVEEPCAYVGKFPKAYFHKYYFDGMSLGESYLRSVDYVPFQMLLYGDPLTRPFAYIPSVSVASPPTGTKSGTITITPTASTSKPSTVIASYDLLVDGVTMNSANFGQSLSLDTTKLSDGRHDLRVLAYDNSAIKNVGRWTSTLDTSNYSHSATLSVSPASGNLVQLFTFTYTASSTGLQEVRLVQNGRVLAASAAASGTLTVYGQNLGAGVSNVKLEAAYSDNRLAWSTPVSVNVSSSGTPAGGAPVAYSYSKRMLAPTATLIELPAKFDAAPSAATYTLLTSPTKATLVQSSSTLPYLIIKPNYNATGTETLQFQVTVGANTSTASVTLVYNFPVTATVVAAASGNARGLAASSTQQGGQYLISSQQHACVWSGTAASLVDLHPPGMTSSVVNAFSGMQQAGFATLSGANRASLWSGTAASWVNLSPAGSTSSVIYGASGTQQVGNAQFSSGISAGLWSGTAASWVSLHPSGATHSFAVSTDGSHQVGEIYPTAGSFHAALWSGTAASFVDLQPSGAEFSVAQGVSGTRQVGYARFSGVTHAGLWSGTAASWVDLSPAGSPGGMANATNGTRQVGWTFTPDNKTHACMWSGSAGTWVDLTTYLPSQYAGYDSSAAAISSDGASIVGYANRAGGTDMIIWTIH